jgi:hypothetical protein
MATLHIEHAVTDFASWKQAYDTFSSNRASGGVRSERVRHPAGDPNQVVIDLDFDSVESAQGFLAFLQTQVWPGASVMSGPAQAVILVDPDGQA